MAEEKKKKRRFGFLAAWGVISILCVCGVLAVAFAPDRDPLPTSSAGATPAPATEAVSASQPTAEIATALPAATEVPASQLGTRFESGGIALTVVDAYLTASVNDFLKPQTGFTYLVLEVVVENVDREEAPYNPLYFSVKDAEGFEYNSTLSAPEPSLKSGTAAQGEITRGFVAFEIKEGASGLMVVYEPLVILGGYEPIRIMLGDLLETR